MGDYIVGLEVGIAVVVEGVAVGDLAIDAADGQIHLVESSGGVVGFLAVDADLADTTAVLLDELFGLDKHAAGATAGVVDTALVGSQHLDQQTDDAGRGVELAALLAFGAGELGEKIFVDAAEDVLAAPGLVAQANVADQIDELAETLLVQARPA
jgi:hypothetical protein